MARKPTRGERNNNPGNIEYSPKTKWQGLADPPVEPEGRFARFKDVIFGIRAIARTLITYYDDHGCNTARKIVNRWAPPHENNVSSYIRTVCAELGGTADETLDLHDYETLRPLVVGIIKHENGRQPYSLSQIDKAMVLAGVEPPKKPLAKSRTMAGATVTAASGAGAIAVGVAQQVSDAAPAVSVVSQVAESAQNHPTGLFIVFGLVAIAAALFIAWTRWDERRKGLH